MMVPKMYCPEQDIVTFYGCIIHLVSKEQNKIALSTTLSGYIALNMIPLCHLLETLNKHVLLNFPLFSIHNICHLDV
jgi:hypothetical protein